MANNDQIVADINDVKKDPGQWIEKAKDNVIIVRDKGHNRIVMLNIDEYRNMRKNYTRVLEPHQISDATMKHMMDGKNIPEEAKQYDDEIKDWKG